MITGNKGEWSELYVFLKLLADGKIHAADGDLNKLEQIYFPILKIIREENSQITEYNTGETIVITLNGQKVKEIPAVEFDIQASELLQAIKSKKAQGAFAIEKSELFMNQILCSKLKVSNQDKSDITLQIIDINTGFSPTVGFSIKSELGSAPTLLNGGKTTNFIYEVTNSDLGFLQTINSINKEVNGKIHTDLRGRINKIVGSQCELVYCDMTNSTFKDNLELIDVRMDKVLAHSLLYYYRDGISSCTEIVSKLEQENPIKYNNKNSYKYKFKKFLAAVALGMKPSVMWDGLDEASGGYIIVTKNGNVVAYHIYNRNHFEDYLLNNTKFETPSTSRYEFGEIYQANNKNFFKLNLTIRFK